MDERQRELWRKQRSKGGKVSQEKARAKREAGIPTVRCLAVSDALYSDEENEFLRAVDRYRVLTGRSILRATEYLGIAKGLGYRRDDIVEPVRDDGRG